MIGIKSIQIVWAARFYGAYSRILMCRTSSNMLKADVVNVRLPGVLGGGGRTEDKTLWLAPFFVCLGRHSG
jgi:hypothetical protein